ncbi:unnamed protein product [Danaus chrysippus]|uniref:(African queen) hypothetical protein n=1 Tax=Danaus chrysippus TaxID=151541 RepID=A0A8J2R450_9NEOP|nr:unnamed protein product [Danaus chrysippus]
MNPFFFFFTWRNPITDFPCLGKFSDTGVCGARPKGVRPLPTKPPRPNLSPLSAEATGTIIRPRLRRRVTAGQLTSRLLFVLSFSATTPRCAEVYAPRTARGLVAVAVRRRCAHTVTSSTPG